MKTDYSKFNLKILQNDMYLVFLLHIDQNHYVLSEVAAPKNKRHDQEAVAVFIADSK